jgi:hypothetical protein
MVHHINKEGQFQSDLHPVPPDKVLVSFKHKEAWPALAALAEAYEEIDPEFSEDIRTRLRTIRNDVSD